MLSFPDMLKKAVNSEDYEDVSYDIKSLFTNIPVKETIEYILHKIYIDKLIKPFCKKSIFNKLLVKITKEYVFFCKFSFIWMPNGWSCVCCFFRHFYV